jgi:hypothetical protein
LYSAVDRVHVGGLPVEMDRDDPLRAGRDLLFDQGRIDVVGVRFDVHEHGLGPHPPDGPGCGEEGVRGGNHLVIRSDALGHEGHQQGIRARGDAAGNGDAAVRGDIRLEGLHLGTEDQALGVAHLVNHWPDLVADRGVLGPQIKKRYLHG